MKIKQLIQAMLLLLTLIVMLTLPAYALSAPADLELKIEQLTNQLEAKRLEYHIPGMAIAVVKDDEIVMAQGFGVMDLQKNTPVTAETLFSIGSSSKAFTATMMAMLVEQKKLAWDGLVSEQLPAYQFEVDNQKLPITYRDMLSHRTGYTRNDLLWANGQASSKLILKTATQAEPVDEFRKNFYYNNVMYLAAGQAMAAVTGKSWDYLLKEMILNPLGMNSTTSVHEDAIAQPQTAMGYQWNDATEQHDLMPRRNLNNVAPAGGIYSNVNDMAQWLRFQLNGGLLNKGQKHQQQLVSQAQLQQTHEPQIEIAAGIDYGMGWMLRQWQNHQVIEHGGNIDGYGAQVALLPDSNLGYVLLTNITATPLQQASMAMVWEHLADKQTTESPPALQAPDYQPFTGEYHANFGPFKEVLFTFLVKADGTPAVDVPGQMVYELIDPDETGKWFFKMTDTISVSFDRSADGAVVAMRMQQNGMNFELPRKGYEIESEVEPGTFDEFLGLYDSKLLNGQIKALVQNQRLTLDIPNQMAFELDLPDGEGYRQFRIKSDTSVKFVRNEAGVVTAVELYKNKAELVETASKAENMSTEVLPTVDEIMQLRQSKARKKALMKNDGFVLMGEVKVKSAGITGQVKTQFDNHSNFKQVMDFGVFGHTTVVVNKTQGSTYGINPYTEFHGKYLKQIQRENPAVDADWRDYYDSIKVTGTSEIGGKAVYKVLLKAQDLPAVTVYIDQLSGDVLKARTQVLIPSMGSINMRIEYQDYREKHGLRLPFKTTINNPMMGEVMVEYTGYLAKQKFDPLVFDISQSK